jgi:tetratricopeptide (TPR) repeat protein
LSTLAFHDKEMAMKAKGVGGIKGIHNLGTRPAKDVSDVKGVGGIKGIHNLRTRPAKDVSDIKGMHSLNSSPGPAGLDWAQGLLKRNMERVHENVSGLRDNLQSGLSLTQSRLQTGVSAAQDALGKGTQRASKSLKKAQENVGRLPGTVQDTLQTGVRTAQDVLGKGTKKASKSLKKEVSPTMQEQYKLIRRYHERSLAIDEELQDKNSITANLGALVDLTIVQGDYGAADQYLERAVQLLTKQGNKKQASEALFNAGRRIYERLKQQNTMAEMQEQCQQARRYYEQSLAIDEELQDKNAITTILEALVDMTIAQRDYGAADQYLERAVQLLTEQGNKKQASEALFNAGRRIYKQLEEQESDQKELAHSIEGSAERG